jgi:hypothetical protein
MAKSRVPLTWVGLVGLTTLAGVVMSGPAAAHAMPVGRTLFESGAITTLIGLEQSLPLAALGIGLAQKHWRTLVLALGLMLTSLAIGSIAARPDDVVAAYGLAPLLFLCGGTVLLSGPRLLAWITPTAAALMGASIGCLSVVSGPGDSRWPWFTAGAATSAMEIVVATALAYSWIARPYLRIPIRIAGSWLVAVGLMFLALAFRPVTPVTAPITSTGTTSTNEALHNTVCPFGHVHGPNGELFCLQPPPKSEGSAINTHPYENAPPDMSSQMRSHRGPTSDP